MSRERARLRGGELGVATSSNRATVRPSEFGLKFTRSGPNMYEVRDVDTDDLVGFTGLEGRLWFALDADGELIAENVSSRVMAGGIALRTARRRAAGEFTPAELADQARRLLSRQQYDAITAVGDARGRHQAILEIYGDLVDYVNAREHFRNLNIDEFRKVVLGRLEKELQNPPR